VGELRRAPTRKERVLAVLEAAAAGGVVVVNGSQIPHDEGWVNGHELTRPDVGGSEGLRRLRELKADGHDIEMRPHPVHGRTSRQYRLVLRERLF